MSHTTLFAETHDAAQEAQVPRVVGIDLSLTCTGLALPPAHADAKSRTIAIKKPSGQTTANGWPELRRLRWMRDQIVNEVTQLADGPHPVLAVIEGIAISRQTGQHMTRAGLWWLVVDALDLIPGVSVAVVTPTCRAKYATGKGNAGKDVVMREVARRFPDFEGGEDEADALVLRAMGLDHLGTPLAAMPQTHRAALAAVDWPEVHHG
jgi:crossover junction endodeoxyribonuclease RuvC